MRYWKRRAVYPPTNNLHRTDHTNKGKKRTADSHMTQMKNVI